MATHAASRADAVAWMSTRQSKVRDDALPCRTNRRRAQKRGGPPAARTMSQPRPNRMLGHAIPFREEQELFATIDS